VCATSGIAQAQKRDACTITASAPVRSNTSITGTAHFSCTEPLPLGTVQVCLYSFPDVPPYLGDLPFFSNRACDAKLIDRPELTVSVTAPCVPPSNATPLQPLKYYGSLGSAVWATTGELRPNSGTAFRIAPKLLLRPC
jgi:hypothetical protein